MLQKNHRGCVVIIVVDPQQSYAPCERRLLHDLHFTPIEMLRNITMHAWLTPLYTDLHFGFCRLRKMQRTDSASTRGTQITGCTCSFLSITNRRSKRRRETQRTERPDRDILNRGDCMQR